jgi:hypothetical protein
MSSNRGQKCHYLVVATAREHIIKFEGPRLVAELLQLTQITDESVWVAAHVSECARFEGSKRLENFWLATSS